MRHLQQYCAAVAALLGPDYPRTSLHARWAEAFQAGLALPVPQVWARGAWPAWIGLGFRCFHCRAVKGAQPLRGSKRSWLRRYQAFLWGISQCCALLPPPHPDPPQGFQRAGELAPQPENPAALLPAWRPLLAASAANAALLQASTPCQLPHACLRLPALLACRGHALRRFDRR